MVTYVAHNDTMLEFATCAGLRPRFALMVCVNWCCVRTGYSADEKDCGHVQEEGMCTRPKMQSLLNMCVNGRTRPNVYMGTY